VSHEAAGAQHRHIQKVLKWPNFMNTKRLNISCFWVTGDQDLW